MKHMVRNVTKYIRIYRLFIKHSFMLLLAHRFNVIMSSVANLAWTSFQLMSLSVLFDKIPHVEGWTFPELIILLAFSQLALYLSYVVFEANLERVWTWISRGDFERMLSRPINIKFYVSFEQLKVAQLLSLVTTVIPLFIYGFVKTEEFKLTEFFYAIVVLGLGIVIMYLIQLTIAGLNFFIDEARAIKNAFIDGMRDMIRIPLELYPSVIRIFFTYLFPLGFTAYFPTMIYRGQSLLKDLIVIEFVIILIAFVISRVVWSRGLKRFSGVSS